MCTCKLTHLGMLTPMKGNADIFLDMNKIAGYHTMRNYPGKEKQILRDIKYSNSKENRIVGLREIGRCLSKCMVPNCKL